MKNKNLWILMLGITGAEFGMWFGLVGNLNYLQNSLDSSLLQSLILLSGVIVGTLFGPYAGSLIDKTSKKNILLYASIARIIAVLVMFLAILYNSVLLVIGYSVLMGISASFYFPAINALIPMIVTQKQLTFANVLQNNLMTIIRIIGAASAGVLLVSVSLYHLYIISLIFYLVLLFSIFFLNINESDLTLNTKKNEIKFREILPILKNEKIIFILLLLSFVPYVFISGFNLMVIEISNIQNSVAITGLLYATEGICILLAGFLIIKVNRSNFILYIICFSCFSMALSQFILSSSNQMYIPFIAFAIFGLSAGIFIPVSNTYFQKNIEPNYHGRFFAFKRILENLIAQFSLVLIGFLLDFIGFNSMMFFFGIISLIIVSICSYYLLIDRKLTIPMKGGEKNEKF
ncbi:MFS transporter [Shouchella tritolerans]|uniref:MFS transporter n=1 Tax=Shouchella tritolerans TaxID=2979466 RepID=UPI000786AE6C|nr:MFS transporter [Shouchella tritolerans]